MGSLLEFYQQWANFLARGDTMNSRHHELESKFPGGESNDFKIENRALTIQGRFRARLTQSGPKPTLNFEAPV